MKEFSHESPREAEAQDLDTVLSSTEAVGRRLHYYLQAVGTDRCLEDDGFILEDDATQGALLVSNYKEKRLKPDRTKDSIYRYASWLPVQRLVDCPGRTVVFKSEKLSHHTGLPNLWIAFNGYWPEREGHFETCTFKELEAYTVISRMPEKHERGVLVLASAGNSAAAFARVCSLNKVPCLVIIPEVGLEAMQFSDPLDPCVKVVSLVGFTDYLDAIALSHLIVKQPGFFAEGGVKNVARRDGMGIAMLSAVEAMGRLPDYYFQAIGSGAGGIAVHEAAKRLVEDGRFGDSTPRLMLSQNLPFVPIYLSWKSQREKLIRLNRDDGKKQIRQILAHVLSNRNPPYEIGGGVYDVLRESRGDMLVADNSESLHAMELFESVEGIDIHPASGVALATLLKCARYGEFKKDSYVLLHITGGGWYRFGFENRRVPARPDLQVDEANISSPETIENIARLFY